MILYYLVICLSLLFPLQSLVSMDWLEGNYRKSWFSPATTVVSCRSFQVRGIVPMFAAAASGVGSVAAVGCHLG